MLRHAKRVLRLEAESSRPAGRCHDFRSARIANRAPQEKLKWAV